MLNVVITKTKGHKETLGGVEYVFYLNCGDGIMGVCICTNSSNYIHLICIVLCNQLYFNKAVFKKKKTKQNLNPSCQRMLILPTCINPFLQRATSNIQPILS